MQVGQLDPIDMTAGPTFPGEMVGPVQLERIHTSPEISATLYDRRVIGVLPPLSRDNVRLVGEVVENPDKVNNSGAGSTTFTIKTDEWLMLP
jgi:hypothetical protein